MPRRKVIDKYHKVKSIGGSQTPIQAKPIGGYGDTRSEQECCNDPLAKAVCQFACVPCIAANGQLQPGNDCFEIVDIWQDCPGGSTVYQWSPYGGHQADGTSNIADACLGKLWQLSAYYGYLGAMMGDNTTGPAGSNSSGGGGFWGAGNCGYQSGGQWFGDYMQQITEEEYIECLNSLHMQASCDGPAFAEQGNTIEVPCMCQAYNQCACAGQQFGPNCNNVMPGGGHHGSSAPKAWRHGGRISSRNRR